MKTETLLVFMRTTFEQCFHKIDTVGYKFKIGTEEDNEIIYSTLRKLLSQLQDCVINSIYLRSLIANSQKNQVLKMLAKIEEPLIV